MKRSKTKNSNVLDSLPSASTAERAALRQARKLQVDPERARRLQKAIRQPGYEELAKRPILDGPPFTL